MKTLHFAEGSVENPDNEPGPLERQFSNTAAESLHEIVWTRCDV